LRGGLGVSALFQIGRGNQALDPAYVGNNGAMPLNLDACDAPEQANMVQMGGDVFESADRGCRTIHIR
jgi:hypothetical protein